MTDREDLFYQKTILNEVEFSGIGLFTGEKTKITLKPAEEGHGIVFQRVDLPSRPKIIANVDAVSQTPRCTVLGEKDQSIYTVEHLLSALHAFQIDNVLIELTGGEVPVGDGSALSFVQMIEKAKIKTFSKPKKMYKITSPIFWSKGEIHLVALPADDFYISYLLDYPGFEVLKSQYITMKIDSSFYKKEIAPCRTFSIYEEIEPLLKNGFIKGGGLNNAVIIKENRILNPDGIRFPNEMARHKVLDLIGDLALLGGGILAHVIAIKSGHFSNVSFAKKILQTVTMEEK